MTDDINIIFMDMDTAVKEQVVKNSDDSYTVFLNSRHSRATVLKALDHALEHIKNEDFRKYDVQKIEAAAHGIPLPDPEEKERERIWKERAEAYRQRAEKEYRRIRRQLRKYDWEAEKGIREMGLWEWNDRQLAIHEAHKADPDW